MALNRLCGSSCCNDVMTNYRLCAFVAARYTGPARDCLSTRVEICSGGLDFALPFNIQSHISSALSTCCCATISTGNRKSVSNVEYLSITAYSIFTGRNRVSSSLMDSSTDSSLQNVAHNQPAPEIVSEPPAPVPPSPYP